MKSKNYKIKSLEMMLAKQQASSNIVFIPINGKSCAGKDYFITQVIDFANMNKSIDVINISSVEKAKEALKILGWNGIDKSVEIRNFLAKIKIDSDNLFNTSFNHLLQTIDKASKTPWKKIIFWHCREPKNIKKAIELVKGKCKYFTLCVENDNIIMQSNDTLIYNMQYDLYIDNTGYPNLIQESHDIVKLIQSI